MRQPIGKLLGRYQNGQCEVFVFVDDFYDHGYPRNCRGRMCGASTTELVGIDAGHHHWLTETDEGLQYRFEDYAEMDGKTPAEIIAWGKQEIADAIVYDGDCFDRVYDTSYREEYWPQIRARGYDEARYLAFDCVGSMGQSEPEWSEVYDLQLLEQWRHWQGLCGAAEGATP